MSDVDLFGREVMQRDAYFANGNRRRLSRHWGPGPRALVIGHNPSEADALKDDPTSRWWNAWFRLFGFGAYDAANLYSFCTASPALCHARVERAFGGEWHDRDEIHANLEEVVRLAKRADQVFVCWGAIARDQDWIEHVIEHIQTGEAPWPDLWCWGTNKDGAPKHPMARGQHRIPADQCPILWRAAA